MESGDSAERSSASSRTQSGDREGSEIPQAVGQSPTTAVVDHTNP